MCPHLDIKSLRILLIALTGRNTLKLFDISIKLKKGIYFDPAIPLLGENTQKTMYMFKKTIYNHFYESTILITKQLLRQIFINKRINKSEYVQTVLNESTIRMNGLHGQVSENDREWKKPLYNHIQHAAAAAKSLQLYPTLCDPIDGSSPIRLPCPWDSPGKNTGVGCHLLLQCMKVKSETEVSQSYPTLSDPMDCSLPGSSIHRIFQARVLEWGAIAFSAYTA